tara:strand:- start:2136 stop:2774 length:639 start_codon:yes stop_codon:yes gene_type:complete
MAYPMGYEPETPLDRMLAEQQAREDAETLRPPMGYSGLTDIERARMGFDSEWQAENQAWADRTFEDPSLIPTDPVGDVLSYATGGIPKAVAGLGMGMFRKPLLKKAITKTASNTPIADARRKIMEDAARRRNKKSLADHAMDIVNKAKSKVGKIFESPGSVAKPPRPPAPTKPPVPKSQIQKTTKNFENLDVDEILRQERIKKMELDMFGPE